MWVMHMGRNLHCVDDDTIYSSYCVNCGRKYFFPRAKTVAKNCGSHTKCGYEIKRENKEQKVLQGFLF